MIARIPIRTVVFSFLIFVLALSIVFWVYQKREYKKTHQLSIKYDAMDARLRDAAKIEGQTLYFSNFALASDTNVIICSDSIKDKTNIGRNSFMLFVWIPAGMCGSCLNSENIFFLKVRDLIEKKGINTLASYYTMRGIISFIRINRIKFPFLIDHQRLLDKKFGDFYSPVYLVVDTKSMKITKAFCSVDPLSYHSLDPNAVALFEVAFLKYIENIFN